MVISFREYVKNNIIPLGLIITLIVGIVLRFKGLTFQSYWIDELFSVTVSNPSNSFSYMYDRTVTDVHPPLYQSLLWGWYHIFGFNEFSGRSLSAIIGSIGIFAVYLLGKEFFNKEVGLYAAILASINHFLIFFSQETRSYSLLFLLSTVSYVYLLKVLTTSSKNNFLLYLLFTIALLYTHYFGFFLVATQAFVFMLHFIKEKGKRKLFVILSIITLIVFILSLLPLMRHILVHEGKKSFWIEVPKVTFFIGYYKSYFHSKTLSLAFLALILLGLKSLFDHSHWNHCKWYLFRPHSNR